MKNRVRWIILFIVMALVSPNAWAVVWDENADPNLTFNLDFQTFTTGVPPTTTATINISPYTRVGTVRDYNTLSTPVLGEVGKVGFDANFSANHDVSPGAGVAKTNPYASQPNDCKITFDNTGGLFNLGNAYPLSLNHTWSYWFKTMNMNSGTMIRNSNNNLDSETGSPDNLWEMRFFGGKLQFYHKNNSLRIETADNMLDLGVTVDEWHQVAFVIARDNDANKVIQNSATTNQKPKIYVDGLESPVIITAFNTLSMDVGPGTTSTLMIGAGGSEFEGSLDDARIYNRSLTAEQICLLSQPDKTIPRARFPIPRSTNVIMGADINWVPILGASDQTVYFGTDSGAMATVATDITGVLSIVTNATLNGPLELNTTYYWRVDSTVGGNPVTGPLWYFTTESGKALNPSPADGAEGIVAGDGTQTTDADLAWFTPTQGTYDVYLSDNKALVDAQNASVRIATGISNMFINDVNTKLRNQDYYWRVVSTYPVGTVSGDTWTFRTKPYVIVFNTSKADSNYTDHMVPAYGVQAKGAAWFNLTADGNSSNTSELAVKGTVGSDGTVIYDFNTFNFDRRFDIIVVPAYRSTDINDTNVIPRPIAIHVKNKNGSGGNFRFDGRVQIAGDNILFASEGSYKSRAGGFPGPKAGQDSSVFSDHAAGVVPVADYWTAYNMPQGNHARFGTQSSAHDLWTPTALAKTVFGPGIGNIPPYKGGGGGAYGGLGGDAGRGYYFGIWTGGTTYGDKEVPVPFGGSAGQSGGGTGAPNGGFGGGGIEIAAEGNVTLDVNSAIKAFGGGQLCAPTKYAGGGGAGGSVKIVANGTVALKGAAGSINVNGGIGGDGSEKGNDTGGGGGGGRVAIFYGSGSAPSASKITAIGGAKGLAAGQGLAQAGQNGTVYIKSFAEASPKKASAPTPVNGDNKFYAPSNPYSLTLKWYSGYNGTNDVVYFGSSIGSMTQVGAPVSATRGQHSATATVSVVLLRTYYWKVVTDGVDSDIWSFRVVGWQCPFVADAAPHVAGPEWDMNQDCMENGLDYAGFAKDWRNPDFSSSMGYTTLWRFVRHWLECSNRTNGGCTAANW